MKTYLRLILKKIVSVLCERWDLVLENMALRHQVEVLKRSGIRPQFTNADRLVWVFLSMVWPRWPEALEIVNADTVKRWRQQGFRSLISRIAGAVNCRLTGLFCNLQNPPATTAKRIADGPVSCQSILQLRHQTVIAPVGFAGCGPPVVKHLFNDPSSAGTPVAVVCSAPIGYTDTYSFRWRKVSQTIHLHNFPHRSNRLAA